MAGQHNSTRIDPSHRASDRWRRRMVGWATSACAPLVFGLSPLAGASAAHADGLDVIFEPIINSIDHAVTGADALSGFGTAASIDLGGLGEGALDQWLTLPTDAVASVGAATDAANGVSATPRGHYFPKRA